MTVAYVIVHYLALEETMACADSILENLREDGHSTHIVIVDNGSGDDGYARLCQTYGDDPRVTLLQSPENLGFARGNNLGFRHAKHVLGADFIVLLNSDTLLEQKDFNRVLVDTYAATGYGVLGPDIVTAQGLHQNPGTRQSWTGGQLMLFRLKRRAENLRSLFLPVAPKANPYRDKKLETPLAHTALHGACWIFSPSYIRDFEGLCPDTFLYMEEDILKLQADIYGFTMAYTPALWVLHKEDASTDMEPGSAGAKLRRKNRHLIRSSRVYSRLLRSHKLRTALEKWVSRVKGSPYSIDPDMAPGYLLSTALRRGLMLIRGLLRRPGLGSARGKVFMGKGVKLRCKGRIHLESGVTLAQGVCLDAMSREGLRIGSGSSIGPGTVIRCSGSLGQLGRGFSMGSRSSLGDHCFVGASGGVRIGDDVIGGQCIRFHSSNHVFSDTGRPIRTQGVTAQGITIGNDCWIGAGAVFCDGVSIGDGCVIGAGSVVTRSFPAGSVLAGVPARLLRTRQKEAQP